MLWKQEMGKIIGVGAPSAFLLGFAAENCIEVRSCYVTYSIDVAAGILIGFYFLSRGYIASICLLSLRKPGP